MKNVFDVIPITGVNARNNCFVRWQLVSNGGGCSPAAGGHCAPEPGRRAPAATPPAGRRPWPSSWCEGEL